MRRKGQAQRGCEDIDSVAGIAFPIRQGITWGRSRRGQSQSADVTEVPRRSPRLTCAMAAVAALTKRPASCPWIGRGGSGKWERRAWFSGRPACRDGIFQGDMGICWSTCERAWLGLWASTAHLNYSPHSRFYLTPTFWFRIYLNNNQKTINLKRLETLQDIKIINQKSSAYMKKGRMENYFDY